MRLLALLLSISMGLQANEPIRAGTVIVSRGDVRNDTGHELLQGSAVYEGQTINTAEKSFIVVQLLDGTKLTVRPSSSVEITEFSDEKAELNLLEGGLRVVTGSIAKNSPENYTVNTPVALMGVRGTEFSVEYRDN